MNHIILVKHSLPEIIPAIPASQWSLSEAGQTRCKTLTEKLMPYSPDVIVSSTEPKAIETAQIIARQMDIPSHLFEGLHEHDRTGVEFLGREQFVSRVQQFFKNPDELVMGRETARQARDRF
ncbi:MAG TPA: histidine phosphatase family protein, partial [Anaerolineales bacterium]|nr:histidine phosphatase family protein [Anaerolineales bacterium]